MTTITLRKKQHIDLALDSASQGTSGFGEKYLLPYKALPDISLAQVNSQVKLFGKKLSQPLIIASMTGGLAHARKINTNLAVAAEQMRVAMGVGSQRIALEKDDAKKTFKLVRKLAPTTVIFANMGAIQLNYSHSVESYQRIVDMIRADALYLHINPMQEALQPEGDINWKGVLQKIAGLVSQIKVPVWVKEVGNGLDRKSIKTLLDIGITGIDVAGTGGTSWTWIEGQRSGNENLAKWFADFGYTTEQALLSAVEFRGKAKIVASGGIRSPIQGLKARLLGADFYSAARPFLEPALKSPEEVISLLTDWEKGLKIAMFGIGVQTWSAAGRVKLAPTKDPR